MLSALAFYLFAFMVLFSAIMVISARNPVHSVLFLILAFFNAAGLFVLLGAEFIAMLLIIVYVGAVAVLFLFVVMMLDVSFAALRKGAMQYIPIGTLVGGVLMVELAMVAAAWMTTEKPESYFMSPAPDGVNNTEALGQVLYTDYVYAFQGAGLILLVAMIGAIVLTHRRRPGIRRQTISDQQARSAAESMEIQKITPGTGV